MVERSGIPRHWRTKKERYQLSGQVCPVCGTASFPAKPVCNTCQQAEAQNPFNSLENILNINPQPQPVPIALKPALVSKAVA